MMSSHAEKIKDSHPQLVSRDQPVRSETSGAIFQFIDNRPEMIAQRKLHKMISEGPRTKLLTPLQREGIQSPKQASPLLVMVGGSTAQQPLHQSAPIQRAVIVHDDHEPSKEDAGGDPLKELIIEALIASKEEHVFSDETAYMANVTMRAELMKCISFLNSDASPFAYNWESDVMKMPPEWEGVKHKSNTPGDDGEGSAFIPAHGQQPKAAIEAIFKPAAGDEKYYIDCSTAILASQYKALLEAYSEAGEGGTFNRAEGSKMALAPEGVAEVKYRVGGFTDAPRDSLKEECALKSFDDLIPGDCVYFKNYTDYEETHDGAEAAWAGEHAVYMGNDCFSGFGADSKKYDQMIKTLKDAYNNQGTNRKWKKREDDEDYGPSLTGKLPGMLKVVTRLKSPAEL